MGLTFLLSQFSEGGGGPVDFTYTHYTTGTEMTINAVPDTPRVASVSPGAGGGGGKKQQQRTTPPSLLSWDFSIRRTKWCHPHPTRAMLFYSLPPYTPLLFK